VSKLKPYLNIPKKPTRNRVRNHINVDFLLKMVVLEDFFGDSRRD
jgi:hypothetical protein